MSNLELLLLWGLLFTIFVVVIRPVIDTLLQLNEQRRLACKARKRAEAYAREHRKLKCQKTNS